ncbi:MAG: phospholipase [Ammonifex sp.]|jgi:NTE family protein|nr:MAG: phospholipase [Ammonifex sp.]
MNRPLVGLALSGGGARGYAHLGVLKALNRSNIPVDLIVGTSMGAVVGAAYVTGYPVDEMEAMASQIRWAQLLRLIDVTFPRYGLLKGQRLEQFFRWLTRDKKFHQLKTPLVAIATDLENKTEVRLKSGAVAAALRATTALPGIFLPAYVDNRLLVDGSLINPVPASAAIEMGAEIILAVDVTSPVDRVNLLLKAKELYRGSPANVTSRHRWQQMLPACLSIVSRSLELCAQKEYHSTRYLPAGKTVISVKPPVQHIKWFEFHRYQECVAAGEIAGLQVAKQIINLLKA